MSNHFLEDSFSTTDFDYPEDSLLSNTLVDDMNNEIVITETMIQLACASLDHDDEAATNSNPRDFK